MIFDPVHTWKKTYLKAGSFTLRKLLVPVFRAGECVYQSPSVMDIRETCRFELDTLWEETRRFSNPHKVYIDLSRKLYDMKYRLLDSLNTSLDGGSVTTQS